MRPLKLKFHQEKVHPNYKDKDVNFFKQKEDGVKHQHLDSTREFQQHSRSIVEALYVVSFMITKQCKLYTIGKTLIKPCASEMARIVLGEESKMKLQQIPLSNDTVHSRIANLSDNTKKQVNAEKIHNSVYFQFNLMKLPTLPLVPNSWCFADTS